MDDIQIFFSDDTERDEFEAISKGYRNDIYVKVNNQFFNVRAYTILRLKQDFESELESYGFYQMEVNMFLVKESSKAEIISTIKYLQKQKFFEEIKSAENIKENELVKIY